MRRVWALSLVLLLAGVEAGRAQQSEAAEPSPSEDASEKAVFTGTVVVTATLSEETLLDVPVSVSVIGSEQLATTPADNMADLLRGVPGLNVIQISARDISVTGRAPTAPFAQGQLVLVDGKPIIDDPNGISYWDMLPVSFDEIDQVEVLHGPGSSIWGSYAQTAVVNLRTKTPRQLQGGAVSLGLGEKNTYTANVRWADVAGDLSYKISGGYYTQDGWDRPATLPDGSPMPDAYVYDNPKTEQPRFDLRFDLDRESGRHWSFRAGYARTSGALLTSTVPAVFESLYSLFADVSYIAGGFDARITYRRLDGEATNLLNGLPSLAVSDTPTAAVTWRKPFGSRQVLVLGGALRYDVFDIDVVPNQDSRFEIGGFIDDQIFLTPRLQLHVGTRIDHLQTTGTTVSPRVGLLVQPTRDHSLRVSWSRAYRPPSIVETYFEVPFAFDVDLGLGTPVSIPSLTAGNPDLDVSRSDGFELGYSGILGGRHTVAATLYQLVIRDLIRFGTTEFYGPDDPPPGWPLPAEFVPAGALPKLSTFGNVGRLLNRGIELSVDSNWTPQLWSRFSYTYQEEPELTRQRPEFPTAVSLPPTHQVGLLVGGGFGPWSGSVGVTFVDEAFWSEFFDPRFWGTTDSYTLFNASARYAIEGTGVDLIFDASNLLDEEARQHAYGDIIGRKVTGSVQYRF